MKLRGLSLFTGIGGLDLALEDWVRPIGYCEKDPACIAVLEARIRDKDLPDAPIFRDIRELTGRELRDVEIIYGGFPCQDISCANNNAKGLEGERSGLFFEIMRLADVFRPEWIFLENVPAITIRGGLRVVSEITARGYDCRWDCFTAAECGYRHLRRRWFLLAHCSELRKEPGRQDAIREADFGAKGVTTNTHSHILRNEYRRSGGQSGRGEAEFAEHGEERITSDAKGRQRRLLESRGEANRQPAEPCTEGATADSNITSETPAKRQASGRRDMEAGSESIGLSEERGAACTSERTTSARMARGVHGVSSRLDIRRSDRYRMLGNAVVPTQGRLAFERLLGL